MARPVCITYDSTCDLTPALLERFQIRVIPLTIIEGEQTFLDDGSYTSEHLYETFRRSGTLPKTAAVSPQEFLDFFLPILAEGMDIVHIDISSDLSSTYQNACLAASELEEGRIHVVDSRHLSTGGGLLALQGANLLKLKPCLQMQEGKLVVGKKYRGPIDKVYRQYVAERFEGKDVLPEHVFITHSGGVAQETLDALMQQVQQAVPGCEVFITQAGCTVSSHCGPGTLGVLFLHRA